MANNDKIKKLIIIAMRNTRFMPDETADNLAEYALICAKVYCAQKDDNPANLTIPEVWLSIALYMQYVGFKVVDNMAEVIHITIKWRTDTEGGTIRSMQIDTRIVEYHTFMLQTLPAL